MIEQKTEGNLVILTGRADADRAEIEAVATSALRERMRVNVFRAASGGTYLVAAMTPVGQEILVRGPAGSFREGMPHSAARRGLSKFGRAALDAA